MIATFFVPKLPGSAARSGYYAWLEHFRLVHDHPTLARILYVRLGFIPYLHTHLSLSYSTVAAASAGVLVFALLGMFTLIGLLTAKPHSSDPRPPLSPVWLGEGAWAAANMPAPPSRRERLAAFNERARQRFSRSREEDAVASLSKDAVPLV